jgi:aminoglycoside 3-N-acetyltransferase
VIEALELAVSQNGTLLMPSFNLVPHAQRAESWQVQATPSTVGYLTECFRLMPGTLRSDHYSHAVAARGAQAQHYVKDHLSREGAVSPWDKEPWGKTFGSMSPMAKAYRDGGKLLMLGVDYHSSTYLHYVEVLTWNRQLQVDPQAKYLWFDRDRLGAYWNTLGRLRQGNVGDAPSRLFPIRDYVDTLLDLVQANPEAWRRRD